MRLLPALLLSAISTAALAQTLVCPPAGTSAGSRPCEAFHYHVAMYRPDTKGFLEVFGLNRFASQESCERVREAAVARNGAVVDYWKRVKGEQEYQPDRFGPCHCDMTTERTSPNFLTDAARVAQRRNAEEIRMRVRERLLDSGLGSDAELVRGLYATPMPAPQLASPKLMPLPQSMAIAAVANPPADLKSSRATAAPPTQTATLDLPLVDVTGVAAPTPTPASAPTPATADVAPPPAPAPSPSSSPAPAPAAASGTPAQPAAPAPDTQHPAPEPQLPTTRVTTEEFVPAEDAAEQFVSTEVQRVQYVLEANNAVTDEQLSNAIREACMQRNVLLSNLRSLIEGSGMKSRLANAARSARGEAERLAFAKKLFGSDMSKHWAPHDAADIILAPQPDADTDPERVLRDSSGRFSDDVRRRALYTLLATSQPTEEQQLWLQTVIDSFLQ